MPSHLFESLPEGRLKLQHVADGYSDMAMIDDTLSMALGDVVVPTIQLPSKPPPARSLYWPGSIGGEAAQSALNFSNVGVFNNEEFSRQIIKVHAILITNISGGAASYHLRRIDRVVVGVTFSAGVPLYVDAATQGTASLGRIIRNNAVTAEGTFVAQYTIPDLQTLTIPVDAVLNHGGLVITGSTINLEVRAAFFYNAFPILHEQPAG